MSHVDNRPVSIRAAIFLGAIFACLPAGRAAWAQERSPDEAKALAEALKPKVGLASFLNETGEESSGLVVKVVEDTLELSLRLLGSYRVERIGADQVGVEELRATAESGSYDSIIVGSVAADAQGGYLLQAKLYDRLKAGYSISREERAERVFEIFDAAERLMRGFLESMSGTHVGFGSIDFTNSGEKGRYEVRIDGESAGFDVARLDLVLNGPHVVTVVQERMLGEVELTRSELVVLEGEGYELSFAVPYELPEERAEIERLYEAARGLSFGSANADSAEKAITRLGELLSETRYCPRLAERGREARDLGRLVEVYRVRFAVEEKAAAPSTSIVEPLRGIREVAASGDEELLCMIRETAGIEAVLLELAAARAYTKRDFAKVFELLVEIEELIDLLGKEDGAYYTWRMVKLGLIFGERSAKRSSLPGFLIGAGATMLAGSAAIFLLDTPGAAMAKAEEAYQRYLASRDPDEVAELHDEVERLYLGANLQTGLMWGGATVGPLIAALGIGNAAKMSLEPKFRRALGDFIAAAVEGAKRFDALRKAEPGGPVLLSADMRTILKLNGEDRSPAPISIAVSEGESLKIEGWFDEKVLDETAGGRSDRLEYIPLSTSARRLLEVAPIRDLEGRLEYSPFPPRETGPASAEAELPSSEAGAATVGEKPYYETEEAWLNPDQPPQEHSGQYSIGDIGPAGGVVFYDKGSDEGGWRYLEAAPYDQSEGVAWWNDSRKYEQPNAFGLGFGQGEKNTQGILRARIRLSDIAASLCGSLSLAGYDDWFLPSRDELNAMYEMREMIGGFASATYWSSTETYRQKTSSNAAWSQSFASGEQYSESVKEQKHHVRAIRSFTAAERLKPAALRSERNQEEKMPLLRLNLGINYFWANHSFDIATETVSSGWSMEDTHLPGIQVGLYLRVIPIIHIGFDVAPALGIIGLQKGEFTIAGAPTICVMIGKPDVIALMAGYFSLHSESCYRIGFVFRRFSASVYFRSLLSGPPFSKINGAGFTIGYMW